MHKIVDALSEYAKTLIGKGNEFPPESLKSKVMRQQLENSLSNKCVSLTLEAVGQQRYLHGDGQSLRQAAWKSFKPQLDRLINSAIDADQAPVFLMTSKGPVREDNHLEDVIIALTSIIPKNYGALIDYVAMINKSHASNKAAVERIGIKHGDEALLKGTVRIETDLKRLRDELETVPGVYRQFDCCVIYEC